MSTKVPANVRSWCIQIQNYQGDRYVSLGARFTDKADAVDEAKQRMRGNVSAGFRLPNGVRVQPTEDLPNQVWNVGKGKWEYVQDVNWEQLQKQVKLTRPGTRIRWQALRALVTYADDRAVRCTDPHDRQFWGSQAIVYREGLPE